MKLYRTTSNLVLEEGGGLRSVEVGLDQIFAADDPIKFVCSNLGDAIEELGSLRAPLENQEVWAAGVTYVVSQQARMEESEEAADVYRRVYDAERPEIFFKSTAGRVAGPGQAVRIRRDSTWDVPEPELTLAVSSTGRIFGYTIGNDMSSRSIEGENPLYLPQAKMWERAAAIGPAILLTDEPLDPKTQISLSIVRGDNEVFAGSVTIDRMKRSFTELVEFLQREMDFAVGVMLMTGTAVVPDASFTLQPDDRITIEIDGIGALENTVEVAPSTERSNLHRRPR